MFVGCLWVAAGLHGALAASFCITKCEAGASHSPAPTPLNTLSASSYLPLPYQPPHPPQ